MGWGGGKKGAGPGERTRERTGDVTTIGFRNRRERGGVSRRSIATGKTRKKERRGRRGRRGGDKDEKWQVSIDLEGPAPLVQSK